MKEEVIAGERGGFDLFFFPGFPGLDGGSGGFGSVGLGGGGARFGLGGFGLGGLRGGVVLGGLFVTLATVIGAVEAGALEDEASAGAEEAADFAPAPGFLAAALLRAGGQGVVLHGLEEFEILFALFAVILVGRHGFAERTGKGSYSTKLGNRNLKLGRGEERRKSGGDG
jgi:hypothetical protein